MWLRWRLWPRWGSGLGGGVKAQLGVVAWRGGYGPGGSFWPWCGVIAQVGVMAWNGELWPR